MLETQQAVRKDDKKPFVSKDSLTAKCNKGTRSQSVIALE